MQNNIVGVVLASGFSKRMGQNKLLMEVFGKPMIEHVILACKNSKLSDFVVVSSHEEVFEICKRLDVKYIKNENSHMGQSQSIVLGTKYFKDKDAIMFLPSDIPKIQSTNIDHLCDKFNGKILVPVYDGMNQNPVIFPSVAFDKLSKLSGDSGGKKVYKDIGYESIEVDYKLFDVDTKEDLRGI